MGFTRKLIFIIILILFTKEIYADDIIDKVYRINSYKYDEISDTFEIKEFGSAVLIGKNKVITNSQIILDENLEPYMNYELCETDNFKRKPICFTVATLDYYDKEKDLAFLNLNKTGKVKKELKLLNKKIKVDDQINIYSYPTNKFILYTKGIISGYKDKNYNIELEKDFKKGLGVIFDKESDFIGVSNFFSLGGKSYGKLIGNKEIISFLKKEGNIIKNKTSGVGKKFYYFLLKKNNSIKLNQIDDKVFSLFNLEKYLIYIYDINYNFDNGLVNYELYSDSGETKITIKNFLQIGEDLTKDDYNNMQDVFYTKTKVLKIKDKEILFSIFVNKKTKDIEIVFNYLNIDYIINGNLSFRNELNKAILLYFKEINYKKIIKSEEKTNNQNNAIINFFRGIKENDTLSKEDFIKYKGVTINNFDNIYVKKYLDEIKLYIKGENKYYEMKIFYDELGNKAIGGKTSYIEDIFTSISEMYSYSVDIISEDLLVSKTTKNYLYYYTFNKNNNKFTHGFLNYSTIGDINYYFTVALDLYEEDLVLKNNIFQFINNLEIEGVEMFRLKSEDNLKNIVNSLD